MVTSGFRCCFRLWEAATKWRLCSDFPSTSAKDYSPFTDLTHNWHWQLPLTLLDPTTRIYYELNQLSINQISTPAVNTYSSEPYSWTVTSCYLTLSSKFNLSNNPVQSPCNYIRLSTNPRLAVSPRQIHLVRMSVKFCSSNYSPFLTGNSYWYLQSLKFPKHWRASQAWDLQFYGPQIEAGPWSQDHWGLLWTSQSTLTAAGIFH